MVGTHTGVFPAGIKLTSHLTANLLGCGLDQHGFTISNTLQGYLARVFWDDNSCRLMGAPLALPGLPGSRSPSREGGGVTRCQPKQHGVLLVPQNKNTRTQEFVKNKAPNFLTVSQASHLPTSNHFSALNHGLNSAGNFQGVRV